MYPFLLELTGYRRYKELQILRFNPGTTIILGESDNPKLPSNASGKSTILFGICVALFGEEPHGGAKDDLINHFSEEYRILLQLGDSPQGPVADTLVILRTKRRSAPEKLEFWYKGMHYSGLLDAVQEDLNGILGIDKKLFFTTIFISPTCEASNFIRAKPGERAALLEQLCFDYRLPIAHERTRRALEKIEVELREAAQHRSYLQAEEKTLTADIAELDAQIRAAQQQSAEARISLANRLQRLQFELEALHMRFTETLDLGPVLQEREELQTHLDTLRQRIALSTMMTGGSGVLGDTCTQCYRPIDEHVRKDWSKARQAFLIELKQFRERELELLGKVRECNEEITRRSRDQERNHSLEERIREKNQEALTIKEERVPDYSAGYAAMRQEKATRLHQAQIESLTSEALTAGRLQQRDRLKFWLEGFGKNGLRNMLLDQLRQEMAIYAQRHLHQLAGGSLHLEFPVLTQKGAFSDKFEIYVKSEEDRQELNMLSDGEFWRSSFSCMLGLGDALLNGTRTLLKFRLIDDPNSQLDAGGKREFLLACEQLAKFYPVIITLPEPPVVRVPASYYQARRIGKTSTVTVEVL